MIFSCLTGRLDVAGHGVRPLMAMGGLILEVGRYCQVLFNSVKSTFDERQKTGESSTLSPSNLSEVQQTHLRFGGVFL